jgi:Na+/H+-translocating membrane pyrophosphatase
MNSYVIYLVPALGLVGLAVMFWKSAWVSKQDAGDEKMQELAGYIADGAMAFLKAEWKVLSRSTRIGSSPWHSSSEQFSQRPPATSA